MRRNEDASSLVTLGLGSNMGDSRLIINNAIAVLDLGIAELRTAFLYQTMPLHVRDQAWFINTAVAGFYSGTPRDLLKYINGIETRFGRNRAIEKRWGERTLDIDILLFENHIVNDEDLVIPHKMLKERRFALEPLLDLFPDARDPVSGFSYWDICQTLPDQGVSLLLYEKSYERDVLPV